MMLSNGIHFILFVCAVFEKPKTVWTRTTMGYDKVDIALLLLSFCIVLYFIIVHNIVFFLTLLLLIFLVLLLIGKGRGVLDGDINGS